MRKEGWGRIGKGGGLMEVGCGKRVERLSMRED